MVLVGGLIAGLLVWNRSRGEAPKPAPTATATATATVAPNLPEFAPPALRQDDEIPTAKPGSGAAPKASSTAVAEGAPAGNPACQACGSGVSNGSLNSAVRGRAGAAQGCYQRALREGGSEGTITVAVSIGSDGSVCGASAVSDTVNNPAITSCVVGKFRAGSFPRPNEGCVTVNVPITFKVK
jgi:outer membrane biosynthesis protein TonB